MRSALLLLLPLLAAAAGLSLQQARMRHLGVCPNQLNPNLWVDAQSTCERECQADQVSAGGYGESGARLGWVWVLHPCGRGGGEAEQRDALGCIGMGVLWALQRPTQCPEHSGSLQPHPGRAPCPKCSKPLCRQRFSLWPFCISPGWNTPTAHPQYAPTQSLRDAGMLGLLPLVTQFSLGRISMPPILGEQLLCSSSLS